MNLEYLHWQVQGVLFRKVECGNILPLVNAGVCNEGKMVDLSQGCT